MTGQVDMPVKYRRQFVMELEAHLRGAAIAFENLPLKDQEELERRSPGDSFARLMKEARQYGKELGGS